MIKLFKKSEKPAEVDVSGVFIGGANYSDEVDEVINKASGLSITPLENNFTENLIGFAKNKKTALRFSIILLFLTILLIGSVFSSQKNQFENPEKGNDKGNNLDDLLKILQK